MFGTRKRRSVSKRVGTRTARETAAHTLWCATLQRAAHGRLNFEAGEFVALEFRSDRDEDAARDGDLVLREHVDAVRARSRGSKKNPGPSPRSSPS